MANKRCPACRVDKDTAEFGRNKSTKDGLQGACKPCTRARIAASEARRRVTTPCSVCFKPRDVDPRWNTAMCQPCSAANATAARTARRQAELALTAEPRAVERAIKITDRWLRRAARFKPPRKPVVRAVTGKRYEIKAAMRRRVFDRDGYVCQLCGTATLDYHDVYNDLSPELDHVLPWHLGGRNSDDNLRVTHRGCNRDREYR